MKTTHIAQFVYAMFWSGSPSLFSHQLSAPSGLRIRRQDVTDGYSARSLEPDKSSIRPVDAWITISEPESIW